MGDAELTETDDLGVEPVEPQVALAKYLSGPGNQKYARFVFAILGSIPWVGSLLAASAALHAEEEQGKVNVLIYQWLEEHEHKYRKLAETVAQILSRLEEIGAAAEERLQDEEFLGLVRRAFRVWDEASTNEKREHVRRTVTNAAATRLCSDDLVRLFLQWIEQYDELHIRVVRVIYRNPGFTRADVWDEIYAGEPVREDSAEADLFKLIMSDLSIGRVLRQHRETTETGQFLTQRPARRRTKASPVLKSAFDDDKAYELTALGRQFVHYVLDEASPVFGASRPT